MDPLVGVQQKDRVAHGIECDLPLLGRVAEGFLSPFPRGDVDIEPQDAANRALYANGRDHAVVDSPFPFVGIFDIPLHDFPGKRAAIVGLPYGEDILGIITILGAFSDSITPVFRSGGILHGKASLRITNPEFKGRIFKGCAELGLALPQGLRHPLRLGDVAPDGLNKIFAAKANGFGSDLYLQFGAALGSVRRFEDIETAADYLLAVAISHPRRTRSPQDRRL